MLLEIKMSGNIDYFVTLKILDYVWYGHNLKEMWSTMKRWFRH